MYARAREGLDSLSTRLWSLKKDYNWACSRGDAERARAFELQMQAITAERDRLIRRLSDNMSLDMARRR